MKQQVRLATTIPRISLNYSRRLSADPPRSIGKREENPKRRSVWNESMFKSLSRKLTFESSYYLRQGSFFTTTESANPQYQLNKRQNMRNYFAVCFSNTQVKTLISQPLNKRCSKTCICGNKPNQTKNMRSYFCLAVLIT